MKIVGFTVVIILFFISLSGWYAYATQSETSCLVDDKERVVKSESSKYLVFCEDEVLENTDSLWYLKFRSSDIYNDLEVGEEYDLRVYGWRVPFFSMYKNIIEIK